MTRAYVTGVHCGAKLKWRDGRCTFVRGWGTDHVDSGRCRIHGGNTPSGKKFAQAEAAEQAVAKLGVPRGTGDPFALIAKAVQHAEGHLEAAAQVLRDSTVTKPSGTTPSGTTPSGVTVDVAAAVAIYEQSIRTAYRTGKAAVDADVADRLAALDERAASLLMRFVTALLDRVVPKTRRAETEAWAAGYLTELAAEYERPGALH